MAKKAKRKVKAKTKAKAKAKRVAPPTIHPEALRHALHNLRFAAFRRSPLQAAAEVALEFAPAAANRDFRVTLDGTEVVYWKGASTPSKARAIGDWVTVLVELMGNPGDSVTINVTHGTPARLTTAAIPSGQTQITEQFVVAAS